MGSILSPINSELWSCSPPNSSFMGPSILMGGECMDFARAHKCNGGCTLCTERCAVWILWRFSSIRSLHFLVSSLSAKQGACVAGNNQSLVCGREHRSRWPLAFRDILAVWLRRLPFRDTCSKARSQPSQPALLPTILFRAPYFQTEGLPLAPLAFSLWSHFSVPALVILFSFSSMALLPNMHIFKSYPPGLSKPKQLCHVYVIDWCLWWNTVFSDPLCYAPWHLPQYLIQRYSSLYLSCINE